MADDLRSTLEAAVATVEKQAEAPAPAPAPSPAPSPAPAPASAPAASPAAAPAPADDPYGEKPAAAPAPGDKSTPEPEEPANEGEQSPEERTSRAPASWKPTAKAKWAALDPDIRADVVRREREITKGLAEASQARKFAGTFQDVIKPFSGRFQQANVHPLRAIQSLLHIDHVMSSASVAERAQYAAKWLKDYQVDINALDLALAGQDPSTAAPEAVIDRMLRERLAPYQQHMQSEQQRQEAQRQADYQKSVEHVERMASDPKFPDFETVREDMADIIEINSRRGVYLTPEQAYTRAVAMNPDAQAAAAQRTQQSRAQQANGQAQRALGASLSVSGNPSALRTNVPATDLRGTIEAAVNAAAGR